MCRKFSQDDLSKLDSQQKDEVICQMQDRLDAMEQRYERLMEQIRIANQEKYGRSTEKLSEIAGQMKFFNEAEANCDDSAKEPGIDDVILSTSKNPRKAKKKGQREDDLKNFPQEEITHDVSVEELNSLFGEGNWKSMPDEIFHQLRFEPARWIDEKHITKVYVGTDGLHQDEFIRGDHPRTLFKGSVATPSLDAAIINSKYVNSTPLDRISRDFEANGLHLSKQTMSNWMVWTAERYLTPVYDLMKVRELQVHVNQCDETPVEVVNDDRPAGSKSYMWVHITGELSPGPKIVVYEYQKTRHSDHPKEFYKNFDGILVTDGLAQYHKIARDLEHLQNANCWAHARRDFADAVKAIGKGNEKAVQDSIAYQALMRIAAIYKLEESLKELSPEQRLIRRKTSIEPLVEEYFTWVNETLESTTVIPKGKTADGLQYSLHQEPYLRLFLQDGEAPIDNSASERAIRNFTIGRKNWMTINTVRGAQASAIIYSITETARANHLNVYYYVRYLLAELIGRMDDSGTIDPLQLESLMPWSKDLPEDCYSKRRS